MTTITLKSIPDPIHAALKQRAKQHGRSLNKEVLACLETAVTPVPVNIHDMLLDIRTHRATLPGRLNDRLIQAANSGRP